MIPKDYYNRPKKEALFACTISVAVLIAILTFSAYAKEIDTFFDLLLKLIL